MRRALTALAFLLLVPAGPWPLHAWSAKQIKVVLEFRRSGAESRESVQGSGGVIITERGRGRASGGVAAESTERTVTQSAGIFTIVQDGGQATLLVASQVPYPQVAYYYDYLARAGSLAAGVAVRDVGTSLMVRAAALPGNQVRVRVTPTLSWFAGDRSGVIEVTEASVELIVPNGRPVVIGGATAQFHELTRQILGVAASQGRSESLVTLTATVLE